MSGQGGQPCHTCFRTIPPAFLPGAGIYIGESLCPVCDIPASAEASARMQALEQIASGSPALHCNASGDHPCAQCSAYIDLARDVLGWARLPAQARTPA